MTFDGLELAIELRWLYSLNGFSCFSFVNCQLNWSLCVRPLDWSQKVYSIHLNAYSNRIKLHANFTFSQKCIDGHISSANRPSFFEVKWIFEQENQLTWSTFEFSDRLIHQMGQFSIALFLCKLHSHFPPVKIRKWQ